MLAIGILTSCAEIDPSRPPIDGNVSAVSAADVQDALAAARKRLAAEGLEKLPIFQVHISGSNSIEVYAGVHYGIAEASNGTARKVLVERRKGKWQVRAVITISDIIVT